MRGVLCFSMIVAIASHAAIADEFKEDGFFIATYPDGSASVSTSNQALAPGWSIDCRVDVMTDQRLCSFYNELGGLHVNYLSTATPQLVCAFGHDYPGMRAVIRVDKNSPIITDENGCIPANEVLAQLISGASVTVRRVEWPNQWNVDKTTTLMGFQKTLDVIERIRSADGASAGNMETAPSDFDVPDKSVELLIATEREFNSRCRGTEGADPKSTVCDDRNKLSLMLNDLGWCYGREDEVGYQSEWHVCAAGSLRLGQ